MFFVCSLFLLLGDAFIGKVITLDLFGYVSGHPHNLLPCDGEVYYYGRMMAQQEADRYYESLLKDIPWQPDEAIIHGKHIVTKRQIAFYGDKDFSYGYSKIRRRAMLWLPILLDLKNAVQNKSHEMYNACLLNLYQEGSHGMAWHSDKEHDLKKHGAIGSLSFGAERFFSFKHKETGQKVTCLLEHGSLLVMKGSTQDYWLHSLPASKSVDCPRVNLTFRTVIT